MPLRQPYASSLVVFDGSDHLYVPTGTGSFPHQVMTGRSFSYAVVGRTDDTLAELTVDAATRVDTLARWPGRTILVLTAGREDVITGRTGAQMSGDIITYAAARLAAGFDNVVVGSITDNTANTAGQETERGTANSTIAFTIGFSGDARYKFADISAAVPDASVVANYSGGKDLTATGVGLVVPVVRTQLDPLLT